MTIKWTKLIFSSNLPSSKKTFAYQLYNFLTTFEAQSLTPYPIGKQQDITIGVGFDLKAGGIVVQNAVFENMGFSANVVSAATKFNLTAAEKEDYTYVQELRKAIEEGGKAGDNTA